jgi:adenylate cyclase
MHFDGGLIGFGFSGLAVAFSFAAAASTRWWVVTKQKEYVSWVAGHYLDRGAFIDRPGEAGKGVEEQASIMFADLSGFTEQSQSLQPAKLTAKVNRYFGEIVPPVDATDGRINRFDGDAMLAFWTERSSVNSQRLRWLRRTLLALRRLVFRCTEGLATKPNHAVRAIKAAFVIIEGVAQLGSEDETRGEKPFTIKVGINSDETQIGDIGSGGHFSYTLMGKGVNLASRLEAVPPLYGCEIVVGDNTARLAQSEFLLRELDRVLVKGASDPMTVYQPVVALNRASAADKDLVDSYANALEHYRAMRFSDAALIWDNLVRKYEPEPSPSSIMAARARDFLTNPPSPSWKAVNVLKSK